MELCKFTDEEYDTSTLKYSFKPRKTNTFIIDDNGYIILDKTLIKFEELISFNFSYSTIAHSINYVHTNDEVSYSLAFKTPSEEIIFSNHIHTGSKRRKNLTNFADNVIKIMTNLFHDDLLRRLLIKIDNGNTLDFGPLKISKYKCQYLRKGSLFSKDEWVPLPKYTKAIIKGGWCSFGDLKMKGIILGDNRWLIPELLNRCNR